MNKLRGIITLALLSGFVSANGGCDFPQQNVPTPQVVRKKIITPRLTTALADNNAPNPSLGFAPAIPEKNVRSSPAAKVAASMPDLRPKSDIAATPPDKGRSTVVANAATPSKAEPKDSPRSPAITSAAVAVTIGDAKASEPPKLQAEEQDAKSLPPAEPVSGAVSVNSTPEAVSSSAAVIQPAIAAPASDPLPAPLASVPPPESNITASSVNPASGLKLPYDPQGRINPFEPLFKDEPEEAPVIAQKKKRVPRTPLERIDLGQLKLVGIIMASSGNRALVQEASGKGYIIREGTFIGLHSGKVTEIQKDRVVIEEETDEVVGTQKMRNKELVLPKPPGE